MFYFIQSRYNRGCLVSLGKIFFWQSLILNLFLILPLKLLFQKCATYVLGYSFIKSSLTLICVKWVPGDPSTIFLAIIFIQQMPESSGSMYSSILMLENMLYHHFTWSGSNSQEIVNLFQFNSGPLGPAVVTKFTSSCEFCPLQVKW